MILQIDIPRGRTAQLLDHLYTKAQESSSDPFWRDLYEQTYEGVKDYKKRQESLRRNSKSLASKKRSLK